MMSTFMELMLRVDRGEMGIARQNVRLSQSRRMARADVEWVIEDGPPGSSDRDLMGRLCRALQDHRAQLTHVRANYDRRNRTSLDVEFVTDSSTYDWITTYDRRSRDREYGRQYLGRPVEPEFDARAAPLPPGRLSDEGQATRDRMWRQYSRPTDPVPLVSQEYGQTLIVRDLPDVATWYTWFCDWVKQCVRLWAQNLDMTSLRYSLIELDSSVKPIILRDIYGAPVKESDDASLRFSLLEIEK